MHKRFGFWDPGSRGRFKKVRKVQDSRINEVASNTNEDLTKLYWANSEDNEADLFK